MNTGARSGTFDAGSQPDMPAFHTKVEGWNSPDTENCLSCSMV